MNYMKLLEELMELKRNTSIQKRREYMKFYMRKWRAKNRARKAPPAKNGGNNHE